MSLYLRLWVKFGHLGLGLGLELWLDFLALQLLILKVLDFLLIMLRRQFLDYWLLRWSDFHDVVPVTGIVSSLWLIFST
jgi:hypothetical protein